MAAIFSLRNWVAKQLMREGEGIMKMPNKGQIDFGEMMVREKLFTGGIDHKLIKSEKQLEHALDSLEAQRKQVLKRDYDEHVGTNIDSSKNYFYTKKEKPSAEVIEVDFDKGRWKDPEDFAHGGRSGYGIGTLVKEKIPPEYRLYAKSILPGGESGKVGSDYFPESFKRELRAQALDKYKRTGKLTGQVGETDQGRSYRKGEATLNKLLQFPSTYASLGTYTYDIDPKTMDVRITDKYDWNPDYGTRKIGGEEMTGWHKPTRSFKGKDVDLGMFKQLAKESWKNKSIDKANLLEMVGNYFGGKESEGKGFDVNIDIPTKEATSATEGSFAQGGRTGLSYLLAEDTNQRVPFAGGLNAARRAFLKAMGAGAAGIGAAKTGLFGLLKGGGKKAVIKDLTSVPIGNPPGIKLLNKVMMLLRQCQPKKEKLFTLKN